MYLDPWMIVSLVICFGACAFLNRRQGFFAGGMHTLQFLEQNRFIKINEDGDIKRWTPYDDKPLKKTRKKKIDI